MTWESSGYTSYKQPSAWALTITLVLLISIIFITRVLKIKIGKSDAIIGNFFSTKITKRKATAESFTLVLERVSIVLVVKL